MKKLKKERNRERNRDVKKMIWEWMNEIGMGKTHIYTSCKILK